MELRDVIFSEIYKLMQSDKKVVVLIADHGAFKLADIKRDFPDRYFNVGISEQNMISVAAGMALDGLKPFVYSIINFTTFRCLEQINVDISMMNLPITILGIGSGFCYTTDGPTHHGVQDIGIMRMIPNLKIFNVSDDTDCVKSINESYKYNGPSYIRFDKGNYQQNKRHIYRQEDGFTIINPSLINKKIIISTGTIVNNILEIYEQTPIGILNIYRLHEFPKIFELYDINKITDLLVIEEHFINGGLGTLILEYINENNYNIRVQRIGINNLHTFVYSDKRYDLLKQYKLDIYNLNRIINNFLQ